MEDLLKIETWRDAALASLTELGSSALIFGGKMIIAVVLLAVGWAVARLTQSVTRRSLTRLGADRLAGRAGVNESLAKVGVARPLSDVAARFLFWMVMLAFALFAVDALELRAVTATIDRLLAFFPRVAGAAIIVVVGVALGRFARNLVASSAVFGDVSDASRLAGVSNATVVTTALVLAIEQLGVDTEILVSVLTAAVAAFGAAGAIAFALGARGVISHVLAGHFLRQRLQAGQPVTIDDISGVVKSVGVVDTVVDSARGTVSIPNGVLIESTVAHTLSGED